MKANTRNPSPSEPATLNASIVFPLGFVLALFLIIFDVLKILYLKSPLAHT